jgi:hypothetical protein
VELYQKTIVKRILGYKVDTIWVSLSHQRVILHIYVLRIEILWLALDFLQCFLDILRQVHVVREEESLLCLDFVDHVHELEVLGLNLAPRVVGQRQEHELVNFEHICLQNLTN